MLTEDGLQKEKPRRSGGRPSSVIFWNFLFSGVARSFLATIDQRG
jgi:hypothetical protein